jgi:hypothetical protein
MRRLQRTARGRTAANFFPVLSAGGTVYYENNVVYVNGQEYGSPEKYYEDATQIAASVPELTEEQGQQIEWMPLGVFALTSEGVNASSMYL